MDAPTLDLYEIAIRVLGLVIDDGGMPSWITKLTRDEGHSPYFHLAIRGLQLRTEYSLRFGEGRGQLVVVLGRRLVKQSPEFGSASAKLIAHKLT